MTRDMANRVLEMAMYCVFAIAILPLTWLGVSDFIYYSQNPEALETRESTLEVFRVIVFMPFISGALLIGSMLALYHLVVGPNLVRFSVLVLVAIYVGMFSLDAIGNFNSLHRVAWDAAIMLVLFLVPVALMVLRWFVLKTPNITLHRTRKNGAPVS